MTDEGFWEVGASGRRYDREYVIRTLLERYSSPHADVWRTQDFRCREVGPNTYLLTYVLVQDGNRTSRRATLWRKSVDGWKILYHQGTLVEDLQNANERTGAE